MADRRALLLERGRRRLQAFREDGVVPSTPVSSVPAQPRGVSDASGATPPSASSLSSSKPEDGAVTPQDTGHGGYYADRDLVTPLPVASALRVGRGKVCVLCRLTPS
jgi:hypothetical protein